MALNTETGNASANSESLCSVSFADTYHALRGADPWATLPTAEKEQALRRASDHFEAMYASRWAGRRVNETQALSWPRYQVPRKDTGGGRLYPAFYPSDSVPLQVQNAFAELALKAAGGELAPDVGRLKASVKVGPIETTYVAGSSPSVRFRLVASLLQPFFSGGGMNIRLVRA